MKKEVKYKVYSSCALLILLILMINSFLLNFGARAQNESVLRIGLIATGPLLFIEGRLDKGAGPAIVMASITTLAHQRWATRDPDGRLIPLLAESWSVSEDGLVITVNIRKNATWSDGYPVIADDAILTYEVLKKEKILDDWGILGYIDRVEKVDDKTYKVYLNRIFYPFLEYWLEYIPIPSHHYKTADNYLSDATTAANETISSGPYRIVEFTKGTRTIKLVANERYWEGLPPFKQVIISLLSPDAVVPALMKSMEYDIIEVPKPAQVAELLKLPNVTVRSFSTRSFWTWNMALWMGILINTDKYPLSEKMFRQAIAYALRRDMITETLTMGYGKISSMGFHPIDSPHVAPDLPVYPYNVTKARELIEKTGFVRGADGFWYYPNGTKLTLKIQARAGDETLVGSLIVTMLREVGIDCTLETLASATYVSNFNLGYFDLGVIRTSHPDSVDFLMMKFYWKPKVPIGQSVHYRGWTRWDNPRFGDLLEEYRKTANPERAKQISYEMQRIIADQLPFIGIYYTEYIWAFRTDTLEGLEILDKGYDWPRLELIYALSPKTKEVKEVEPAPLTIPVELVVMIVVVAVAITAVLVYVLQRARKS